MIFLLHVPATHRVYSPLTHILIPRFVHDSDWSKALLTKIKVKGHREVSRWKTKYTTYYVIHPCIISYAVTGYQEQHCPIKVSGTV
jgi:hypothetical protein